MYALDEPPPTSDVLRPIRIKPHKRKYPPRACPECGSTATWYKSPRRIYCRQCKRYRALYTADYAGNAAWRALDANNGKYFEEWGTDDTPFDEQAQRELLAICDRMNREELLYLRGASKPIEKETVTASCGTSQL